MKNMPPANKAGNVASSIKLSYQHLKKARNMAATVVITVVMSKLIFYPVAASIAAIPVETLVTILLGSF